MGFNGSQDATRSTGMEASVPRVRGWTDQQKVGVCGDGSANVYVTFGRGGGGCGRGPWALRRAWMLPGVAGKLRSRLGVLGGEA